jgi:hypothetical protein
MTTTNVARNWFKNYGRDTFRSWDFIVAVGFGGVGFGLAFVAAVRQAAVPILITEAAIGVAMTATVFGALAVFTTFYDGTYRRVLELAGGFRSALMPYIAIGVVAATAGLSGLIAALALPALGVWATAFAVAIPTLLCAWTLTGTVSLIEITLFHATERARLMAGADEAESIRAERLSRHAS